MLETKTQRIKNILQMGSNKFCSFFIEEVAAAAADGFPIAFECINLEAVFK